MAKTTLTLPDSLHQRLVLTADYHNKPLLVFIREVLEQVLQSEEEVRTKKMYQDLQDLKGIGPKGVSDASTTINENLYGADPA